MPGIDVIRAEIQHMRSQVLRQRAGIPSSSAEALLEKMLNKIDELRAERDRLKREQPGYNKGKVLRRW
jgi:hypothetical protein